RMPVEVSTLTIVLAFIVFSCRLKPFFIAPRGRQRRDTDVQISENRSGRQFQSPGFWCRRLCWALVRSASFSANEQHVHGRPDLVERSLRGECLQPLRLASFGGGPRAEEGRRGPQRVRLPAVAAAAFGRVRARLCVSLDPAQGRRATDRPF